MNRNNIWIHVSIAVLLITIAAVLGQIDRWRSALQGPPQRTVQVDVKPSADDNRRIAGMPEILVRFKPGIDLDRVREITELNHDVLHDEIESVSGLSIIDDLDDADAQTVAEQYASMSDVVEYAEPNFQIDLDTKESMDWHPLAHDLLYRTNEASKFTFLLPNDPQFGDQWALNNVGQNGGKARADIDALKAWLTSKGNRDVVVAVLDTGVDLKHVDLVENLWKRPETVPAYSDDELGQIDDQYGFDGTDAIQDPMDDNGHGTHCAGIIGAEGDNGEGIAGVNWRVKIMPLKFLGRGGFGGVDAAIEAINYAIDRKKHGVNIRVISASWGSNQNSRALRDTIKAAGDAGILFVAAAGNDGSDNDRRPHYPSNFDLPNVVSVAALDRSDKLAGFSNYGPKTVHIAAPGKDILSTWLNNNYREASGTSMATPYVSGVAALIVANQPSISMERLRAKLLSSVDKVDGLAGRVASGGRINAAKALAK